MWAADQSDWLTADVDTKNVRLKELPLAALLERVAGGDSNAFDLVYHEHQPKLYAAAYRILRNSADAADAVHDALLQVWQNAHRFDPSMGTARSWIYAIVRYRSVEVLRRRLHHHSLERDALNGMEDDDPSPLLQIETKFLAQYLRRHLDDLDPKLIRLLTLAFYGDLSYNQVAAEVGAPVGTVKSQFRRTLRHLRQQLDG